MVLKILIYRCIYILHNLFVDNYDSGTSDGVFAMAAAAPDDSSLPSISDMVTCYPSMPGVNIILSYNYYCKL